MNLLQRIAVGLIGIPAIYLLIRLGSWPLLLLVAAQASLTCGEFYSLAAHKYPRAFTRIGVAMALLLPVAAFGGASCGVLWVFPLAVLAAPAVVAVGGLLSGSETDGFIARTSITGFGIIYIGGLFSLQVPLRAAPGGVDWLLLAYLVTWTVDTGGYVVGRLVGRHKLWPRLSPGKTWEGALGGTLFALALSWGVGSEVMGLFGTATALAYGLAASIIAPLGDLVESVFKRDIGVKDSSSILPGHGGLLDRFDSFLLVLPLTLLFQILFG
ncbi:MAG: hypothetical protein FVQ81_09290 [Candidatus Glassbacteria bacterium]|nr:hypothetical protein [Candidatus Glassbacteria bacterium]